MNDYEFEMAEREYEREQAARGRCLSCKEEIFYEKAQSAHREGHIYSDAGLSEFRISGFCEYCFDKVTAEPEEDEYVDHGGWEDH